MRHRIRTVWITALTLAALLLSGVSLGAANTVVLAAQPDHMVAVSDDARHPCPATVVHTTSVQDDCCNPDNISWDNSCCSGNGSANYLLQSASIDLSGHLFSLALITHDLAATPHFFINPRFRPPIN